MVVGDPRSEEETLGRTVRGLLLRGRAGALCTTAAQRGLEGFPFGSVVPYALSAEGHLLVLLARIATHTANLRRDPRASLLVRDEEAEGDPQASWRITVIGAFERLRVEGERPSDGDVVLDRDTWTELFARYQERVPAAVDYDRTHDFDLWRLREPVRLRYIGGFGEIHWVAGERMLRDPGGEGLAEAAAGAVAHLNEDHPHHLVELVEGLLGLSPERAEAVGVDRTGLLLRLHAPDRLVHCSFGREIGAGELRTAVVELLRHARSVRR
ncbi:MAG: pyridoxamine 5'-phosphate oxidase family protein [Alphaproteobacteria bacterium]|nr:pyridoxamine 5'-phosphate oxidase family protein [Alphaproteobacteria bacterium]